MPKKSFLTKRVWGVLITALVFCVHVHAARPIRVLFTAALIEDHDGNRQKNYIRNLQKLKQYGCDVYVVESCQNGPTYLNKYCDHVCYTRSNNIHATKSNNEVRSMLIGINHFKFGPDDMIIKVTGRYVLEDNQFISLVKSYIDADVIARIWNSADAYTGYFAMRKNRFVEMLEHYYRVYYTANPYFAVEHALGTYIELNKNSLRVIPIPILYNYPSVPERR